MCLQICNHPDLLERAKWEAAEVGRVGVGGVGGGAETWRQAAALAWSRPARVFVCSSRRNLKGMCRACGCSAALPLAQDYGNPERSGKMQVLAKVLRHWHEAGHK